MAAVRGNLRDSARKGGLGSGEARMKGSRAYQKYFEGYEEMALPKKNGKGTRIVRVYRGDYYLEDVPDSAWRGGKVLYALCYVLSFTAFLAAALPARPGNMTWYAVIPQAVAVLAYFWLLTVVCSRIVSDRRMTISKYKRAVLPLPYACEAVLLMLGLALLMQVLHAAVSAAAGTAAGAGETVLTWLLYAAAAGLIAVIFRREKATEYRREKA